MSSAAQQFSEWLQDTHPDLYQLLLEKAVLLSFAGFGDDTLTEFAPDIPDTSFSSSVSDIPDFTVTADQLDTMNAAEGNLPSLSTDVAVGSSITDAAASGGGFLQTVGSGIASAAESVGNFLTSPAGAKALTSVATAYFGLQNNKVNAQIQGQVLQAQIARMNAGASPLPIGYATTSQGQVVPVYTGAAPGVLTPYIAGGQSQYIPGYGYTVPPAALPSLTGSVSLNQLLPWVLLIGGALLLAKEL